MACIAALLLCCFLTIPAIAEQACPVCGATMQLSSTNPVTKSLWREFTPELHIREYYYNWYCFSCNASHQTLFRTEYGNHSISVIVRDLGHLAIGTHRYLVGCFQCERTEVRAVICAGPPCPVPFNTVPGVTE